MTSWEYAEVRWFPENLARSETTWFSVKERKTVEMHGLQVLEQASTEGWEVIGYRSTGDAAGRASIALLRRALVNAAEHQPGSLRRTGR
jgi:hypothetical protein